MAIPENSISKMYPGRFLEAADLAGKTITVKIESIKGDQLETDKGKKRAYFLNFVGKKKALLLNKTNALFLGAMFGDNPNAWEGKRIAIYPTKTSFGPDTVDCIRVFGSPDLAEDKVFSGKIGYKKVTAKLRLVKAGEQEAPSPISEEMVPDEQVLEAWGYLGWTRDEGQKDLNGYRGSDYLGHLSTLIDQKNAEEAS